MFSKIIRARFANPPYLEDKPVAEEDRKLVDKEQVCQSTT